MSLALRPYQEEGRDFLAGRTRALLADEMRVGKAPQAILAAAEIDAQHSLVVCPAIAVPQWEAEWRRWGGPGRATVRSFEKARRDLDTLRCGQYDVLIVDECHYTTNPEAMRTRMVYGKDGLGHAAKRIWSLSGTPAKKHAAELWPMLRAFGVVGCSYPDFVTQYCWFKQDGRIGGTKEHRIPEVKSLLAQIMLRRTRKQVAPQMPGIAFDFLNVKPVSQPTAQLPAMNDAELLDYIERNAAHEQAFRIEVAMAKALPLVEQVAFAIDNELLAQTVIFGHHVQPLLAVADGLNLRGIATDVLNGTTSAKRRVEIREDFMAGRTRVLCANIATAGTAVDLSAASHGFFLELDWVPANNVQAASRLVSMAKAEPVTMDVVNWPGSPDDRVVQVLVRRAREISQLY